MATPTINTYVSDMLALEQHMLQPLKTQANDEKLSAYPAAASCITAALSTTEAHVSALEARLEALGGHAGSGVKSGVASAVGAAAAVVGQVRKTEFSKNLRDDYSSLCLASASYTMLQSAALGLGDVQTAALAKKHLGDVASVIIRISEALSPVVLQELAEEGATVDPTAASKAKAGSEEAWETAGAAAR